jgi:SseB protein N-terminal domain
VHRHLNPGGQQFGGDHGAADPQVAAALAAYQAGRGSEQAALAGLAAARLLVPVIAVLADGSVSPGADGSVSPDAEGSVSPPADGPDDPASSPGDKNSEMMLPTLIGRDGRRAMLAFTCLDALARWRPSARPVPAEADRVWRAAIAGGCAVVIDVAGPVPLAVEGARLAALAAGQPPPPPHEDPDVRAAIEAAVAGEPAITGFSLSAGRSDGTDLAVTLRLVRPGPAAPDWGPAANRAAASIAGRLAGRLRRGIEVGVAVPGE